MKIPTKPLTNTIFWMVSFLIDPGLRYDYKLVQEGSQHFYISRMRDLKYPQVNTSDEKLKTDLETVLNLALNSKVFKIYYHFNEVPTRKLIIARYKCLEAKIEVSSNTAIFKPKSEILEEFYIEFDDINQNKDKIELDISIKAEGVKAHYTFYNKNGRWDYLEPMIIEY